MGVRALFWDVDTQHDFMDEDGRLSVPGAQAIVPNLAALTQFAARNGIPIVASADAHAPDDPEFEEFGPHCLVGTPGQRKIEATVLPGAEVAAPERLAEQCVRLAAGILPQLVVEKQALDVFTVPAAEQLLDALQPRKVYAYGVTTEYCVLQAVLGLIIRGCEVVVIADAVKAIEEAAGRDALDQMGRAGAEMTETGALLAELCGDARA